MYRAGNSVEQVFGGTVIKQGDRTPLGFNFRTENGELVYLTGSTVQVKVASDKGVVLEKQATISDEYTAQFAIGSQDITGAGDMRVEFIVTYPGGTIEKFPSDDWQRIRITPTLEDVEKYGVGYITFEKLTGEFQNQFDEFTGGVDQQIDYQKKRVDNLIQSTPQPSEVVDARFDETGKSFTNLKAHLDDKGKKIDALLKKQKGIISILEKENFKIAIADGYDWTPALQACVDEIENNYTNGGRITLPPEKILFSNNILVGNSKDRKVFPIEIIGSGMGKTILQPLNTTGYGFFNLRNYGNTIKDLSFFYPKQVNGTQSFSFQGVTEPKIYPSTIYGTGNFTTIENVEFINSYDAIRLGIKEGSEVYEAKYVNIINVKGFPLKSGLSLDSLRGSANIDRVTFSFETTWSSEYKVIGGSDLHNWVLNNGRAVAILGGEGDINALNVHRYQTGLYFGVDANRSGGASDSFKVKNTWIDVCRYPLQVGAFGGFLRFSDCVFAGAHGETSTNPSTENINLFGGSGKLIFDKVEFRNFAGPAITTTINFVLENCFFENWNKLNAYHPAINIATASVTITLDGTRIGSVVSPTRFLFSDKATSLVIVSKGNYTGCDEIARLTQLDSKLVLEGNILPAHKASFWNGTTVYASLVLYSDKVPEAGIYQQGDVVINTSPTKLGTAGSRYIIEKWICISGGASPIWIEKRYTTGD